MSKKLLRGVETVESGVKVTMVPGVIGEEERVEHDDHVSFVFYSFAKMAFTHIYCTNSQHYVMSSKLLVYPPY